MSKFRNLIESVLLNEAFIIKIPVEEVNQFNEYPNKYILVYKNPSKSELNQIQNNSKEHELRGLIIDNNVYIWDSYFAIHTDIVNALKSRLNIPSDSYITDFLYLPNDQLEAGYTQHKDNYYIKDINKTIDSMLNCPICIKLFGKDNIKGMAPHQEWSYDELDEAKQVGNLYHSTTYNNAINILKTNTLYSDRSFGISTNRNLDLFKKGFGDVCFVLDGDKLSSKYKIFPFQFGQEDSQETIVQDKKASQFKSIEDYHDKLTGLERNLQYYGWNTDRGLTIQKPEISNIQNYILKVYVNTNINDKNELLELLNAYNIPFESIKTINNPENDRSNYHYKIATNSYKPKYDSDEYTYKSNTTLSDLYNLTEKARIIYNLLINENIKLKLQLSNNQKTYEFIINKKENPSIQNFDFNKLINDNTLGEKDVLQIKNTPNNYILSYSGNDIYSPDMPLTKVPNKYKTYEYCLNQIVNYENRNASLTDIPDEFKTYELYLAGLKSGFISMYDVPDEYKTEELCKAYLETDPYSIDGIPEKYLDYNTCLKACKRNPNNISNVPDKFKTKELCKIVIDKLDLSPYSDDLYIYNKYIPDKFKKIK